MKIPAQRLTNQHLVRPLDAAPSKVVSWFGAIQAQDYLAALWALGQRTAGATDATIEAALSDGSVLRTHIFRGTWQCVAREDVRWMLDLVGPRVIAGSRSRLRELGLDEKLLRKCGVLFARALEGGAHLTRLEMAEVLARGRVPSVRGRLMHILGHAELDGIIVSGGRRGKQRTFALLEHRAPRARRLVRDEALAELAVRYFQSRGPATLRDFAWWTGLPMRDLRVAIELAGRSLESATLEGETWWSRPGRSGSLRRGRASLLPAFDEYLVGYTDRSAVLDARFAKQVNAGGGMLRPAVVIDGKVVGTWSRRLVKTGAEVSVRPFNRFTRAERQAVDAALTRYVKFLGASS